MKQNLIVVSNMKPICETLSQKFPLLGYEVFSFKDVSEPIRELNSLDPDLVIIDVDDDRRKWKIFASGLKLAKKKITIVLLASSMTPDEANEASILGVSGIIIKPFLPEVHLKRIFEIVHRKYKMMGKRIYPRFYAGLSFEGELQFQDLEKGEIYSCPLVNISEMGAAISINHPDEASELVKGYSIPNATLTLDNQKINISFEIVFRKGDLIGILFKDMGEGKSNFIRFIQTMSLKVFGKPEIKGKW